MSDDIEDQAPLDRQDGILFDVADGGGQEMPGALFLIREMTGTCRGDDGVFMPFMRLLLVPDEEAHQPSSAVTALVAMSPELATTLAAGLKLSVRQAAARNAGTHPKSKENPDA